MAGGWSRDGAVQDQIDASVDEAVERARRQLGSGKSAKVCDECRGIITEARRKAIPGVQLCIKCQSKLEENGTQSTGAARTVSLGEIEVEPEGNDEMDFVTIYLTASEVIGRC
jgi:phage/conjugal plasmid C-4 type zinc finger TraR family protein